jgi:DNA-binding NarL/FixJ family response regulator
MPRKVTNAIILLKNSFAKEHISQVLAKHGINLLPSPKNASQASLLIELQKPNLFICDDCLDTAEIILSKFKTNIFCPKTILFVDKSKMEDIIEYYTWGVLGILRVDSPPMELSEAIKTILDNNIYICSAYKKSIKKEQLGSTAIYCKLSNREKEVMTLIGCGLTNHQIGEKLKLSPHSINNHRAKIRKKLNLKGGKSNLIQVAISTIF